jgi:hypothetical protein
MFFQGEKRSFYLYVLIDRNYIYIYFFFAKLKLKTINRSNEQEEKKRRVYENNEFFPFFAPMRSFIKDLSNLHTDFFSSVLSLSFLWVIRRQQQQRKGEGKNLNKEQDASGKRASCVARTYYYDCVCVCVWLHKREKVIDEWEQRERENVEWSGCNSGTAH